MTKECVLCGKDFEADHNLRIYCERCRKLSDRRKNSEFENIERSNSRYDAMIWKPNIFEGSCEICGKYIKKELKYVWKRKDIGKNILHYFCSRDCMKVYEQEI